MEQHRIDYVDLMKGICIVLIVLLHCWIVPSNKHYADMLNAFRMPLYFFLSGLFFKDYGSLQNLIIKKTNRLLIPWVVFALLPIVYEIFLFPRQYGHHYSDLLSARYYASLLFEDHNGALWFLRCLFLANIIYYFINKVEDFRWRALSVLATAGVAYAWMAMRSGAQNDALNVLLTRSTLPMAAMASAFFFLAQCLKRVGVLAHQFKWWQVLLTFAGSIGVLYFTAQSGVRWKYELMPNNALLVLLAAIAGIAIVWSVAYTFKKLPYLSYIGRYSIVVLVTHVAIIRIMLFGYKVDRYTTAITVLASAPILIYLLTQYAPYITAQKDFFEIEQNSNTK